MNKDEIAGLVDRWAEHGPETGIVAPFARR